MRRKPRKKPNRVPDRRKAILRHADEITRALDFLSSNLTLLCLGMPDVSVGAGIERIKRLLKKKKFGDFRRGPVRMPIYVKTRKLEHLQRIARRPFRKNHKTVKAYQAAWRASSRIMNKYRIRAYGKNGRPLYRYIPADTTFQGRRVNYIEVGGDGKKRGGTIGIMARRHKKSFFVWIHVFIHIKESRLDAAKVPEAFEQVCKASGERCFKSRFHDYGDDGGSLEFHWKKLDRRLER